MGGRGQGEPRRGKGAGLPGRALRVTFPFAFLSPWIFEMLLGKLTQPARSLSERLSAGGCRRFWGWLNAVFNK